MGPVRASVTTGLCARASQPRGRRSRLRGRGCLGVLGGGAARRLARPAVDEPDARERARAAPLDHRVAGRGGGRGDPLRRARHWCKLVNGAGRRARRPAARRGARRRAGDRGLLLGDHLPGLQGLALQQLLVGRLPSRRPDGRPAGGQDRLVVTSASARVGTPARVARERRRAELRHDERPAVVLELVPELRRLAFQLANRIAGGRPDEEDVAVGAHLAQRCVV
jgi:hypothetical protein